MKNLAIFLITFTLPAEFRGVAAAHPRITYDLLMKSAWETVRTFGQNDRQLAGTPWPLPTTHRLQPSCRASTGPSPCRTCPWSLRVSGAEEE
jgi:hypothetical protein